METAAKTNEAALLFGLAGKILYTYPSEEFYKNLDEEKIFSEIPFSCGNAEYKEGAELLKKWHDSEKENKYSALVTDYQDLFVGVSDAVKAPIWESVYVSHDPILFQDSTLKVRRWYAKYDLQVENMRSEPDDSAGQELMFFAFLLSSGKEDEAGAFFKEHINAWIPDFCGRVEAAARSAFFRGLALLVKGAVKGYENK